MIVSCSGNLLKMFLEAGKFRLLMTSLTCSGRTLSEYKYLRIKELPCTMCGFIEILVVIHHVLLPASCLLNSSDELSEIVSLKVS